MQKIDIQDDLLIVYLLGEASPGEIKQVEDWRENDAGCNQRFQEFKALWEASRQLDGDEAVDTEASFYRYKERSLGLKNIRIRSIRNKQIRTWLAVAASALLFTAAAWLYFSATRVSNIRLTTLTKTQTGSLPDGSVVTLNRLSSFEYPSRFSGAKRQVRLDSGEAFFSVAHNKAKPFLITAGHVSIRVVGTSFNVKNKKGVVEVIVETGRVQVSGAGQQVLLRPGEKLTVTQSAKKLEPERNPDQLYNYYRTKKFVAENTPLSRMVEVLNEAYGCHIVIARKELNDLPLNTTFNEQSLAKILDVISRTFRISVEQKNGNIILK